MNWIFTVIITVILVELFLRLPLISTAVAVSETAKRATKTMKRKASDHLKERAIQLCALRMLSASLVLFIGLFVLAIAAYVLCLTAEHVSAGTIETLVSFKGLLVSLVFASFYIFARQRITR